MHLNLDLGRRLGRGPESADFGICVLRLAEAGRDHVRLQVLVLFWFFWKCSLHTIKVRSIPNTSDLPRHMRMRRQRNVE